MTTEIRLVYRDADGAVINIGTWNEAEGAWPPGTSWQEEEVASTPDGARYAAADGMPDHLAPALSDRQMAQALAERGLISQAEALAWVSDGTLPAAFEALIGGLPAEDQFGARMHLTGSTTFLRQHPLVKAFGAAHGMTAADIDELWLFAASLT